LKKIRVFGFKTCLIGPGVAIVKSALNYYQSPAHQEEKPRNAGFFIYYNFIYVYK